MNIFSAFPSDILKLFLDNYFPLHFINYPYNKLLVGLDCRYEKIIKEKLYLIKIDDNFRVMMEYAKKGDLRRIEYIVRRNSLLLYNLNKIPRFYKWDVEYLKFGLKGAVLGGSLECVKYLSSIYLKREGPKNVEDYFNKLIFHAASSRNLKIIKYLIIFYYENLIDKYIDNELYIKYLSYKNSSKYLLSLGFNPFILVRGTVKSGNIQFLEELGKLDKNYSKEIIEYFLRGQKSTIKSGDYSMIEYLFNYYHTYKKDKHDIEKNGFDRAEESNFKNNFLSAVANSGNIKFLMKYVEKYNNIRDFEKYQYFKEEHLRLVENLRSRCYQNSVIKLYITLEEYIKHQPNRGVQECRRFVKAKNIKLIKWWIENAAMLNLNDYYTKLFLFTDVGKWGNIEAIELLVNFITPDEKEKRNSYITCMVGASKYRNIPLIGYLMKKVGLSKNKLFLKVLKNHSSSLHNGFENLIEYLIQIGANDWEGGSKQRYIANRYIYYFRQLAEGKNLNFSDLEYGESSE